VADSAEFGSESTGLYIELKIPGPLAVNDLSESTSNLTFPCEGGTMKYHTFGQQKQLLATNTEFQVSILTKTNGTYEISALHRSQPAGKTTTYQLISVSGCDADSSDRQYNEHSFTYIAPSFPPRTFNHTNPHRISGRAVIDQQSFPPKEVVFEWDFERYLLQE